MRLAFLFCFWTCNTLAVDPVFPPPKTLGPTDTYGTHLTRAMSRMASATAEKRTPVRVLFYGQSITEQNWWKLVGDDLKQRFPHADFTIENRAIGGFSSQILVKTAETDLYSFQPDLLIFHVYGSHIEYENIIKRVRERTVAEVLIQTDHLAKNDSLAEPTDAKTLTPKQWNPWMNYTFLPETARKYGCELSDQRNLWKQYLKDYNLKPEALLKDSVHLNDHGNYVMAELVKPYLRVPKELPNTDDRVKTFVVGKNVKVDNGVLRIPFEGNRVEVVLGPKGGAKVDVTIDGKKPSGFPELQGQTRTTPYPGSKWPCLLLVGHDKPRVLEEWTVELFEVKENVKQFRFKVTGSVTGMDGEGDSKTKFVSQSGRVVIDPADWNFNYCVKVFGMKIKDGFQVKWRVLPQYVDSFTPQATRDGTREETRTVALGLPPGPHVLELKSTDLSTIVAVRAYVPPLFGKTKGQ